MSSSGAEHASCDIIWNGTRAGGEPSGSVGQELEKYEAALLLLLGFGVFSILLAVAYNAIRRYVFRDVSNLDSSFDAGGRVTTSLTAVTVGVQLLWPADLLQSATVTSKGGLLAHWQAVRATPHQSDPSQEGDSRWMPHSPRIIPMRRRGPEMGIAGAFWYSTAVVVNIILFPLLSVHFKTRAPGAKTFLQVVRARFGKRTHIVFCCFALLTNVTILTAIIISGTDLFKALIKDMNNEFCVLIMATLFGSYSFVGGLGSTFYVSYFNALMVFVILATFVARIFYLPVESLPFGDLQTVYERITCLQGPEDNLHRSYVTFLSADSMVWMVQGVFIAASVTFCDQASWQSRIAAKPLQGVIGFYGATFLWFAIPSTIGTTAAITYLSFSAGNASLTLSAGDIDSGLVVPYIAQQAMGRDGAFMILIMFTMLMMSTGSGEVMGISSIIVYDIFQSYICPYKLGPRLHHCILCNKRKREETEYNPLKTSDTESDFCCCTPAAECDRCIEDEEAIRSSSGFARQLLRPRCNIHGDYRIYQDALVRLKSWTILWVSVAIIPYGLMVIRSGIDLNWVFLTGCIMTIPCFPGVVLSIVWVKTTAKGMVIGAIVGLICGIIATLSRASTLPGGLGDFLINTSEGYTVMTGSCTSFFVSLIVTIIVSVVTHNIKEDKDASEEWLKVRDIDNPLNPWINFYRDEFPNLRGYQKPSYEQLTKVFRKANITAIAGSVFCLVLFVLFIPGVMASLRVLSSSQFTSWVMTMHVWCFVMAAIVILVTPLEEVRVIWRELKKRKMHDDREDNHCELKDIRA